MPFPFLAAIPAIGGLLGNLLGGGARGAAQERTTQNTFQQGQNQQALQQYGIQQQALIQALLGQDRGATDRYQTAQGARMQALGGQQAATSNALNAQSAEGLQRARLGLEAPSVRARQSLLGSLMQNLQPVSVEGGNARVRANMPQISGGLTPAAIDPLTRQHGGELMQAALQAQRSGSDIPSATNFMGGVQDWQSGLMAPPEPTDFRSGLLPPPELGGYRQPGRGESIMSWGSSIGNILAALVPLIQGSRGGGGNGPPAGMGY